MFFLGRDFVFGLLCAVKTEKKLLKNFTTSKPKKLFHKKTYRFSSSALDKTNPGLSEECAVGTRLDKWTN